jgi:outer membrane protein assembly factor BamA
LDDRIRFSLPVTHGDLNLKYYGKGDDSPLREHPIDYKAIGNFLVPRVSVETPVDNWFLGGQYRLINTRTKFEDPVSDTDTQGLDQQVQTAGFGLVSLFDSRDSNLWPSQGNWLDLTASLNGAYAGGDFEYFKSEMKWAQYFPLADSLVLVYRIDGQYIDGDAPFWDLSRVRLRGYTSGQLVDNVALTAQMETRWNFSGRWTVLAFGGGGRIAGEVSDIGNADNKMAGGVGFRFMVAEEQKLAMGIDAAYAEGADIAVYFQVGDWLTN